MAYYVSFQLFLLPIIGKMSLLKYLPFHEKRISWLFTNLLLLGQEGELPVIQLSRIVFIFRTYIQKVVCYTV